MPDALRLMTFNVQLLPVIAGVFEGTTSVPAGIIGLLPKGDGDSEARAEAVAKDLLRIKAAERPHVIGLNEVFNEDGRRILKKRLKPLYPHVIESVHEGDLDEDAGLMVFSRIPFQTTPSGGDREELFYGTDAGDDSWASKAAVMVRVNQPVEQTTLVFTHLQASYLSEDQHRDVRAEQLRELVQWIDDLFQGDVAQWARLVLAGDLNIRGDEGMTSDEWFDHFDRPGPVSEHLLDNWIRMRPPGETRDHDPGLTHRVRETGERMRLDYVATGLGDDPPALVAHAMRIGHRDTSDHFALEALIQRPDAHSQPATATDLASMTPWVGDASSGQPVTSRVFGVQTEISEPGGRHWIWLREPGTYSFHAAPALALDVFSDADLSTPLTRLDQLVTVELPPALQGPYREFERQIDPRGDTFVCRTPMFVSVRHRKGLPAAGLPVLVLEHLGDSAASAISIPPGLEVPVPFPSGQRLGDDDTAWFRVEPRAALVAGPRTEQVCLTPPDGRDAEVTVLDSALAPLGPSASGSGVLTVDVPVFDDDTFYAQVTRDGDDAVGHTIRWETPLTYLRLSEGFVVHVADETSADWPGADEPELRITIDGDPVALLETTWDDADTGEDWPGLTEGLLSAARQRGWLQPSIAFVDALGLSLEEPDPPLGLAHAGIDHSIKALSPSEPSTAERTLTVTVFDSVSDGTYTVSCTLSRDP